MWSEKNLLTAHGTLEGNQAHVSNKGKLNTLTLLHEI